VKAIITCTLVRRMLSSSFVLPVSTWPMMHTMAERSRSGVRDAMASFERFSRSVRASIFPRTASSSSLSDSLSSSSLPLSESLSESPSDFCEARERPLKVREKVMEGHGR